MSLVMSLSTPVALIIFNRPDVTAQVFAAIRQARPRRLFVIADAPRSPADEPACQATRAVVAAVDWDCKVQTNFSAANLGCGRRPATGIDWVFSQVDEAIILEDDCLPVPSFFSFCEQLLAHYREDRRVMHISGTRTQGVYTPGTYSYYFSRYTHNWGWATWKRAWQSYDYEIKTWPRFKAEGLLPALFDPLEAGFWENKLDPIYEQERDDAWDYQWNYTVWTQGGLSILPAVNLVTNLGFRADATHTRSPNRRTNLPVGAIGNLVHPSFLVPNREADRLTFEEFFGGRRLRERRTWKYRLAKPARLLRKWQERARAAKQA